MSAIGGIVAVAHTGDVPGFTGILAHEEDVANCPKWERHRPKWPEFPVGKRES